MKMLRTFAFLALSVVALNSAPAGADTQSCGLAAVRDPELRASFERFERNQSPAAARLCAIYLNSMGGLPVR